MLTRAAPAFYRNAQGSMSPEAVQAISQSMMNCAQPLEHRGSVSLSRPLPQQSNGVLQSVGWNPSDYSNLFPEGATNSFIELPGNGGYTFGGNGDWNSTFYGSPNFDLSTQLQQNLNQYYSGPTLTVQGDTVFQNNVTENQYVTNLTVQYINGEPAPGVPGAQGPGGPQGARGLDGAPGLGNFVFNNVVNRRIIINPVWPLWLQIWLLVRQIQVLTGYAEDIDRRLKGLKIEGWPQGNQVLTGATFNENTCTISAEGRNVALKISGNR